MEIKPKPTEEFAEYGLPQIQSDIGDLVHYSTHLDHLLWEHGWPLDNVSAERGITTSRTEIYPKNFSCDFSKTCAL
jgi:hypothetical protein